MKTVFITGADRGLGLGLAREMLGAGLRVFAGQYMPEWPELGALRDAHPSALSIVPLDVGDMGSVRSAVRAVEKEAEGLDAFVSNSGVIGRYKDARIGDGQNYGDMLNVYNVNALGPLRATEAFLPLLARGGGRRLCFVSSEAGSIGASARNNWYGYCMSKSALNMAVSILFNDLRPEGYTFRLYHPGWVRSYMLGMKNDAATYEPDEAAAMAFGYLMSENGAVDEDKLVLRDFSGKEWPW
jgi:NAD(P)-dependent dehydrogenase (short-subunit alcohol dehydrogenase family)